MQGHTLTERVAYTDSCECGAPLLESALARRTAGVVVCANLHEWVVRDRLIEVDGTTRWRLAEPLEKYRRLADVFQPSESRA
jgi:hypothetical protein